MIETFLLGGFLLCGVVDDGDGAGHVFPVLANYTERQCNREANKRPGFWCVKREPGMTFAENCTKDF
jgi:hypothetical protein